jgi:hypothetical protein
MLKFPLGNKNYKGKYNKKLTKVVFSDMVKVERNTYWCYKNVGFNENVMNQDEYAMINGEKWKIIELENTE